MLLEKVRTRLVEESSDGNEIRINSDCNVVVVSDLHIDYKKDRPMYFWEILKYLDRIIETLRWLDNPVCIFLGDIFDKDLNMQKGVLYYESALERFKTIQKVTDGRCFMVYGNHEDTYIDINPSAMIMKPSEHLKGIMQTNKLKEISRGFGDILRTPLNIRVFDTKITLFHYNKYEKDYSTVGGDCEYHIGMFHDTYVNNTMRDKVNKSVPVDLIWKREMKDLNLNYIDMAIFGDFHIPVPPFRINNRRNTTVIIPGSYGRNNIKTETHNSVKLPIIELKRDCKPKIKITEFQLEEYTLSYNLGSKMKSTSDINNKLRMMTSKMKERSEKEISIQNFSSFIYSTYGEEWGNKVYIYMKNNIKDGLFNRKGEQELE